MSIKTRTRDHDRVSTQPSQSRDLSRSLSLRFSLLLFLFLALSGGTYFAVLAAVTAKEHDSVIVNLAGRQRMLTQKYARDIDLVLVALAGSDRELVIKMKEAASQTAEIYSATLSALLEGGEVDTGEEGRIWIPPVQGDDLVQHLGNVKTTWEALQRTALKAVQSGSSSLARNDNVREILTQTAKAVAEMSHVVFLMQKQSEVRLRRVELYMAYAYILSVILFVGTVMFVRRKIVVPLDHTVTALETEIAERKRTEEALRESEERMELVLRGADLGTWDWNVQTGDVTFNERLTTMLGYTLDEIEPHVSSWQKLAHPDDVPIVAKAMKAHVDGRTNSYETEHRLLHKSGDWVWVLDKGRVIERDADGKPLRACGTHLDLTTRKRLEEELKLRTHDLGERVKELNCLYTISNIAERPDISLEQILKGTVDIIPSSWQYPEVTTARITLQDQVYKTANFRESGWRQVSEIIVKDKPIGSVEVYYLDERPASDEGPFLKEERSLINAIADRLGKVIMRIQLEDERVILKEQLHQAQKMEAIAQLAGGVAHDFNNLLTVIFGYVSLAKKVLPDNHGATHALDGLQEVAEQAAGITRSLLTFSHKKITRKEPVELQTTVNKSLRMLRHVLPANIEVVIDATNEPVWVRADGTQLQQIIMNLAINARDAMPDGGMLRISVSQSDRIPSESNTNGIANGRLAFLSVSDSGTGIEPDVLDRIFEPFFTTKPKEHGTGLGLAITHSIIEDHAGRIQVESEPGQGTTFHMELPLLEDHTSQDTSDEITLPRRGLGEMILLAEDNRHVRGILTSALESLEYKVVQVSDGSALMDCFERYSKWIKLLVIDVDLPKRNGLDCLREIRSSGSFVPAIIITANAEADVEKQFDSDTTLLIKPFQIAEFTSLAGNVLVVQPQQETQA